MIKRNERLRTPWIALISVVTALFAMTAKADDPPWVDEKDRAGRAAKVLDALMVAPDKRIPAELLEQSRAVAVFPGVIKGAFLFGGQFGTGIAAARDENDDWGIPAYVEIAGGSFGLQLGGEAIDLILVFMETEALDEILKDNLKIGVDAGAVAGPVGRQVAVATNFTFDAPIYSYSRNQGAFVGVSLEGSIVQIDDGANREVYGDGVTGTDILVRGNVAEHEATKAFSEALQRHAPSEILSAAAAKSPLD